MSGNYLNEYCTHYCKQEHVESNALNNWKLKLFKIIDEPFKFDLLPPKPKWCFPHLKQGSQEFHRKYVLYPADIAANNVVFVWRLHYTNTLIQELDNINTYKWVSTDVKAIVNTHSIDITAQFVEGIKENQDKLPTLYWNRNFKNVSLKTLLQQGTAESKFMVT